MIEKLDGSVERIYQDNGSQFKPRFFPVINALLKQGPMSIKSLSEQTQVSHSAVSQTVAAMKKIGYVTSEPGEDKRERQIVLTEKMRAELPKLQEIWQAVHTAAQKLDRETSASLHTTLSLSISALDDKSFYQRISEEMAV
ncbi:MAG: MarR family winged helix-turn-helix transcriptional regulator [Pseudomonadota bacterium]